MRTTAHTRGVRAPIWQGKFRGRFVGKFESVLLTLRRENRVTLRQPRYP
jgi:hypothetical protein